MIRTMQVDDAPQVWDIFTRSLGYRCDADVVRARIADLAHDPKQVCLVWADDATNEAKAFLHAERYDTLHNAKAAWNLINLAVVPEAQGKGIGRELLEHFEAFAEQSGAEFIKLNSRMERTGAHAFYEHLGYEGAKVQRYFIKRFDL